jgi:two-component system sensor histidine kinase BaeS
VRLRFFLTFTLIALVSILAVVVFFSIDAGNQVRQFISQGGMLGLDSLVQNLEGYYNQNQGWSGVQTMLADFTFQNGMHFGQGRGQNGQGMMGQGQGLGMGSMNLDIYLVDAKGNVLYDSSGSNQVSSFSPGDLAQGIEINASNGQTVGYILVPESALTSPASQQGLIDRISSAGLRAGLVAVGIALVLALILANGLLRPIRTLSKAAQGMSAGDLSQRAEVKGKDELANLAVTFNRMAASLESSEQRRKALTADIAHELRTPLAVQRAQVEAILDGVYPLDEENLQKVLAQNELLTRLVEDLRTLALADSGELELHMGQVDLSGLIRRVVERFEPAAQPRVLVVQAAGEQHLFARGDSLRIEQIFNNLLSNAIRYTPENGKIEIRCREQDGLIHSLIHDSGPGIPIADLERIFDRFYRGEHSRSRDAGGTGLGLAIARQLAVAQGGDLTARNDPAGGAVFELTLRSTTP